MSAPLLTNKATQYVVDCEYNAPTNELISMAIVPLWPGGNCPSFDQVLSLLKPSADPRREFYEVLELPPEKQIDPWVMENVIPHLDRTPVSKAEFQKRLETFLQDFIVEALHYDWCDDIAYVNRALITGPGTRLELPHQALVHVHHTGIETASDVPHNALHDARAIAAEIRKRLFPQKL